MLKFGGEMMMGRDLKPEERKTTTGNNTDENLRLRKVKVLYVCVWVSETHHGVNSVGRV